KQKELDAALNANETVGNALLANSATWGFVRMAEPIIQFKDVSFSFGQEQIYDRLSFNVDPGAFVCVLGPSGCGKSTSLRLIGDLIPTAEGQVLVEGKSPKEAWQNLAYVFQSPRLVPWRNAIKNVTL